MDGDPAGRDDKVVAFRRRTPEAARPPSRQEDLEADRARARSNIVALAVAALLVFAGWLLVQKLGQTSRLEDCLMSGRTNCAPIAAMPRGE